MALANEAFLNKIFVDKNIKMLVQEQPLWEAYMPKSSVDAQTILYYKEQYFDYTTPNDSALSRTLDPNQRAPAYRADEAEFMHADIGVPKEYNLRLYRLGLEMDFSEDEKRYAYLENRVVKKQEKLAIYFANEMNTIVGNALTETFSATPSSINVVTASDHWSHGPGSSSVNPVSDLLGCMEKIHDTPGFNYDATHIFLPVQSYYDLVDWMTQKNYQYTYQKLDGKPDVMNALGLQVVKSNMVKRDMGVVADIRKAGTIFECEPLSTNVYYEDAKHKTHMQVWRMFNFALTDPKAICSLVDLVA